MLETTSVQAPFETGHASDPARASYEIETCLKGKDVQISDLIESIEVPNINDERTIELIKSWTPDIVIDFGTRKVGMAIIDLLPEKIFNLHGGDPEHYRGLDTHMWAMYHKDFDALSTSLHSLNADLDDGDIVETQKVSLFKDMKIHQFRRANTQTCIEMVLRMLGTYTKKGSVNIQPQVQKGRYYSFMPYVLKDIAAQNFEAYTETLR